MKTLKRVFLDPKEKQNFTKIGKSKDLITLEKKIEDSKEELLTINDKANEIEKDISVKSKEIDNLLIKISKLDLAGKEKEEKELNKKIMVLNGQLDSFNDSFIVLQSSYTELNEYIVGLTEKVNTFKDDIGILSEVIKEEKEKLLDSIKTLKKENDKLIVVNKEEKEKAGVEMKEVVKERKLVEKEKERIGEIKQEALTYINRVAKQNKVDKINKEVKELL